MTDMIELRLQINEARLLGRLMALGLEVVADPPIELSAEEVVQTMREIRVLQKSLPGLSRTLAGMHGALAEIPYAEGIL